MNSDSALEFFLEQLETFILMWQRPAAYFQLFPFLVAMVASYVSSRFVWQQLEQQRPALWRLRRINKWRRRLRWLGLLSLRYLTYPVVGLVLMNLVILLFQAQGWVVALLTHLSSVFWLLFYYRLLLVLLYFLFGQRHIRPYHRRVLTPLFILIILWLLSELSIGLRSLLQIRLGAGEEGIIVGQVVWAVIDVYFLVALAWAIQHSLEAFIFPRTKIDQGIIEASLTIGRYAVIIFGVFIVLTSLGFDITTLTVVSGGLSVGIGFGLQKIVSNFFTGLILMFEQSVRPGDIIEVGGAIGLVQKLNVRATIVRRPDNVLLIIPNETLFTSNITSYTRNDRITQLSFDVSAPAERDPEEVMELLRQVCAGHKLVMKDPPPEIFLKNYGKASLDFSLGIWLEEPDYRSQVPGELRVRIFKEFKNRGY